MQEMFQNGYPNLNPALLFVCTELEIMQERSIEHTESTNNFLFTVKPLVTASSL